MTKLTLEQHEFDVLKEIIAERLKRLKETIYRNNAILSHHELDITNYTTYDLYCKVMEVDK